MRIKKVLRQALAIAVTCFVTTLWVLGIGGMWVVSLNEGIIWGTTHCTVVNLGDHDPSNNVVECSFVFGIVPLIFATLLIPFVAAWTYSIAIGEEEAVK